MRAAVALLCLYAAIATASAEHRSREFNGVTASFTALNPSLRARDTLKVRFSLWNQSSRAVTFRYYAMFLYHVDIFTALGKRVELKMNAPIPEPIAVEISLKPGEKFKRIEELQLSAWYDLKPGDYYLIFRYDLRDLPDSIARFYKRSHHSTDFVTWDSKKYTFHIQL